MFEAASAAVVMVMVVAVIFIIIKYHNTKNLHVVLVIPMCLVCGVMVFIRTEYLMWEPVMTSDFMKQDASGETCSPSGRQEILHILWSTKVNYRIHKSPPPVLILRQIDPVYVVTSCFLKMHFNIHLHLGLPSCRLTSVFPAETLYAFLPLTPPTSPVFC